MTNERNQSPAFSPSAIAKSPTGIAGFDEITNGGLPQGRPSLVCGSAGAGKTLFGMEFLVRGATMYDEPGVFVAFEEKAEDLIANTASLGFDLADLIEKRKLMVDYIHLERSEIEVTGEYDLEGLFIRLGYAIDTIGAKRVVLDTLESLYGAFANAFILRAELRRLFLWLKDKGVTAVVTAERGDGTLTRHGMEEYVSDCVILLDHQVANQISTRRLRIIKYRGSEHGTNEYPFLIDRDGLSVLPITSLGLEHSVLNEHIPTGIEQLDAMLGGKGYFVGSTVLVSGTAGSGKTSLAAHLVDAACRRGERCLYIASEESMNQLIRNMRSIGLDLQQWVDSGHLKFYAARPTAYGLEMYLAVVHRIIRQDSPQVVVIDPITNLMVAGTSVEVKVMLMRLIDFLKVQHITAFMTSLTHAGPALEQTDAGISSLIDTWLLVRDTESNGERNRLITVLKSRGMAHSNQTREFLVTDQGIELLSPYVGSEGFVTGSARAVYEAQEQATALNEALELERLRLGLEDKRKMVEAEIAALRASFAADVEQVTRLLQQYQQRDQLRRDSQSMIERSRQAVNVDPQNENP